ncbi:MAG: hypothetical protein ACYTFG_04000, partial [Planctomycetota bacterium]
AKALVKKQVIVKRLEMKKRESKLKEKRERKRHQLDREYYEELKQYYQDEIEKRVPKTPVYTAKGTLKGLGLMVLRRGTHKLIDAYGHEAYTLRAAPNSGIDLYHWKYFEKEVGIVGTVKYADGWPTKIIEVKKIEVLEKKKEQ